MNAHIDQIVNIAAPQHRLTTARSQYLDQYLDPVGAFDFKLCTHVIETL